MELCLCCPRRGRCKSCPFACWWYATPGHQELRSPLAGARQCWRWYFGLVIITNSRDLGLFELHVTLHHLTQIDSVKVLKFRACIQLFILDSLFLGPFICHLPSLRNTIYFHVLSGGQHGYRPSLLDRPANCISYPGPQELKWDHLCYNFDQDVIGILSSLNGRSFICAMQMLSIYVSRTKANKYVLSPLQSYILCLHVMIGRHSGDFLRLSTTCQVL